MQFHDRLDILPGLKAGRSEGKCVVASLRESGAGGRSASCGCLKIAIEPVLDVAHHRQVRIKLLPLVARQPVPQALDIPHREIEDTLADGAATLSGLLGRWIVRDSESLE